MKSQMDRNKKGERWDEKLSYKNVKRQRYIIYQRDGEDVVSYASFFSPRSLFMKKSFFFRFRYSYFIFFRKRYKKIKNNDL